MAQDAGDVAVAAGHHVRTVIGRVRDAAKKHPTLALAAAAGVGAVAGVELAFGALIGIALTSLVTNQTGHDVREQIMRRGRAILGQS